MLDLPAEIWSSLPVLSSIPGDWPPYSLLAVSSWNRYNVLIVSCITKLVQMPGLAFLELFVLLSTLLILSRFLPAPGLGPRSRAQLSLPNGFLCMSIPAVATRLSTTHRRPTSQVNTLSLVNVGDDLLGNWAHECVEFWLNARHLLGIDFSRFDRSCSTSWVSHPRVLIAQQLLIDCARYQRMIVRTRS